LARRTSIYELQDSAMLSWLAKKSGELTRDIVDITMNTVDAVIEAPDSFMEGYENKDNQPKPEKGTECINEKRDNSKGVS
jgi:hypothetical protein